MKDAIRSEWIKLRSVRSNVVLLIVIVVLSLGVCILASILAGSSNFGTEADDPLLVILPGVGLSSVLVGVVGAQVIGQEFRFNTVRATFAAVPRRGRVLTAKGVVTAVATTVTIVAMIALCLLTSWIISSARGLSLDLGRDGVPRALAGTVMLCVLYALIGLGLAALVRNAVLAIVVIIVWPFVLEPIVGALLGLAVDDVGKWFPFTAGNAMTTVDPDVFTESVSPLTGFLILGGLTTVMLAAGWIAVHRRDA
jgi:ABC-2 type transport system permease protein